MGSPQRAAVSALSTPPAITHEDIALAFPQTWPPSSLIPSV